MGIAQGPTLGINAPESVAESLPRLGLEPSMPQWHKIQVEKMSLQASVEEVGEWEHTGGRVDIGETGL